MLRLIFANLMICAGITLAQLPAPASAAERCGNSACVVLHKGQTRGRMPVACVSIPFIKEREGKVAMFVLSAFHPPATPDAEIHDQLDQNALFKDSKVTGPVDDFCRGAAKFAGGKWVVFCDDRHWGAITGEALAYAIKNGHPPGNRPVKIGTHV